MKSANFGPFDRQVVIMNADGKGFSVLQNPQAMRLKKDGLIRDRQFVRQPAEEELEKALGQKDQPWESLSKEYLEEAVTRLAWQSLQQDLRMCASLHRKPIF